MDHIDLGVASFDPASGVLRHSSGEEKLLRPQSARLLAELARTPRTARSKEELLDAIWGDIAVTEGSLTQCVADIRRALGDEDRRILQTLPKFGYRLVPPSAGWSDAAPPIEPLADAPIRFATAADGSRLAWTASGSGPPMLKAPSWISNIEMEARSLIFTEFYRWLGDRVRLIRFDQRGTSLSDRVEGALRIGDMVDDMLAVADAAGIERFFLFGPRRASPSPLPSRASIPTACWGSSGAAASAGDGWSPIARPSDASTKAARP